MEKYIDIKGFEGLYSFWTDGNNNYKVISKEKSIKHCNGAIHHRKKREKNIYDDSLGYLYADLWKEGKRYRIGVHRLVYWYFNGILDSNLDIDHIDGNPHNNSINNLRLVTHKENMNNMVTKIRLKKGIKKAIEEGRLKINKKPVWVYSITDDFSKRYDSVVEAQDELNIANVGSVANGKSKVAGHYIASWEELSKEQVTKRVEELKNNNHLRCNFGLEPFPKGYQKVDSKKNAKSISGYKDGILFINFKSIGEAEAYTGLSNWYLKKFIKTQTPFKGITYKFD